MGRDMADKLLAKVLYGTDDAAEIYRRKTTEKQRRAFAATTEPVTLTADECKRLCDKMASGLQYLDGYEARVRAYTVSDETVDRYGDVIVAKGATFDNYLRNPQVMFAHDYDELPVGNALKAWVDKGAHAVKAWALFFDNRVDASGRSDLVFRFVQANALPACSVGFMPLQWHKPEEKEARDRGMDDGNGIVFDEWDMMEFSAVAIPANPNALKESVRKSMRDQFTATLRSGLFGAGDVDVLKRWPLFPGDVLDAFVKELGSRSVVVPKDIGHDPGGLILPNDITTKIIDAVTTSPLTFTTDTDTRIYTTGTVIGMLAHLTDAIDIDGEAVLRPYPNEHAARLKDPGDFDKFRRKADGEIYGKVKVPATVDVVWGHLKDGADDAWAPQALRFPVKDWTEDAAKKWLADNEVKYIAFEPAAEKAVDPTITYWQMVLTDEDVKRIVEQFTKAMDERVVALVASSREEVRAAVAEIVTIAKQALSAGAMQSQQAPDSTYAGVLDKVFTKSGKR